ncbi:MAG TPA: 4-(cytidine 5'-diphospho)-2-C-methyl-D-erythritol kinase [Longimicrobiales bacterium]|nr:4-(cytidine 5'-diphospho)-2-C-methyl-D-erythritol kinase [Longimicrobiales bacterium]
MRPRGSSSVAEVEAPAKVNLFLRVFDERPDRFHELETLFQAVDFADHVRVERAEAGVQLELRGAGADLGPMEENLAYRAAARLLGEAGIEGGFRISLLKRIPVGAGLGGGSSDAAAVLRCAAALAGIPDDDPRLRRMGAELGSDVAFFLGPSPLAAGRGRGDVLEPFGALPVPDLVLVSPPVHVSTAWAYRALDESRRAHGAAPAPSLKGRPRDWGDVAAEAHNDFQPVVATAHPEVTRSLAALSAAGARPALMSGSGSTSFGIFASRVAAEKAAEGLRSDLGWTCSVVRTLTAFPAPRLS